MNNLFTEIDITDSWNKLISQLNNGDIYFAPGFTLYDAMSATELFDRKVDVKVDLDKADTPQNLLSRGLIKPAEQLTEGEILALYDLVLGKEVLWYRGNSLPQTIYTLVYQYSDELVGSNQMVQGLFKSMNSVNQSVYGIVKNAPYLREEDYIPSIFSMRSDAIPIAEMVTNILNPLDAAVTKKIKNKKQLQALDGISARIKIRKGLANLIGVLGVPFSAESEKLINSQIEFIRKRIEIARETFKFSEDVSNYESHNIFKHIPAMIGQRACPTIEPTQTYDLLENMLQQLETIFKISKEKNLFKIIDQLNNLIHNNPKNTLVRAYLEQNLFKFDPFTYFNHTPLITIIKNFLVNMYPQFSQQFESKQPEVVNYLEYLTSICYEYIIKMLKGDFRQMRDFHKIYQHFSILIHESTKIDEVLFQGTKNPLMIFSYELALNMMFKQLTLGFKLEIYDLSELCYIFYYMEYFQTIHEKNRTNYLNTIPQGQLQTLLNKTQKKKKTLTDIQEQFYNEIPYYKGLNLIFRAYSRLFYVLRERNLIPTHGDPQYRYSNTLKIFEQCYFIKPVGYEEFVLRMQETYKNEEMVIHALDFVTENLKEAQNQFKQIDGTVSDFIVAQQKDLIKVVFVDQLKKKDMCYVIRCYYETIDEYFQRCQGEPLGQMWNSLYSPY